MAYTGEKKREYDRRWIADRKQRAIALLGARCVRCGSAEDLEIDHIDPMTKDPILRSPKLRQGFPWTWSWQRITAELSKCQILCRGCHRRKTNAEIGRRYCSHGHDTYATGRDSQHRCIACRREREYPVRNTRRRGE